MNIAVIYKSKYGSTEKYAKWLGEDLGADVYANSKLKIEDFEKYDVIIYGGGIYAGGINGISFITKNYDKLKEKTLILYTCGLSDPTVKENLEAINKAVEKIFEEDIKGATGNTIKVFNLRGGINYKKLSFIHKRMMSMLKRMISKKPEGELREEDREMLRTYGDEVDFTSRNSIKPIIEYIKNKKS